MNKKKELQNELVTVHTDLAHEKEAWEQMAMEKRETERNIEVLTQQVKQLEAEKQALQLDFGNTATLLQVTFFYLLFLYYYSCYYYYLYNY